MQAFGDSIPLRDLKVIVTGSRYFSEFEVRTQSVLGLVVESRGEVEMPKVPVLVMYSYMDPCPGVLELLLLYPRAGHA